MKTPLLRDDAFLEDVRNARREGAGLHLWWLGQSGFLVHWGGRFLLLDPYLSDSLTKKYANSDKPHERVSELVVTPGRLDFVDVVTSSHCHTDHLDPETLQPLVRVNPQLVMVCPEANRATVRERSGLPDERILGVDATAPGQTSRGPSRGLVEGTDFGPAGEPPALRSVAGFTIHAVPAAHETVETDRWGRHVYLGFVVKAGPWTLYHSGDTVLFPGMVECLRPYRIDVALLPINGRLQERRVAGNLWGREAAQLGRATRAGCIIPCHYDLFAFNTASPEEFVTTCRLLGQPFLVLQQGERWTAASR